METLSLDPALWKQAGGWFYCRGSLTLALPRSGFPILQPLCVENLNTHTRVPPPVTPCALLPASTANPQGPTPALGSPHQPGLWGSSSTAEPPCSPHRVPGSGQARSSVWCVDGDVVDKVCGNFCSLSCPAQSCSSSGQSSPTSVLKSMRNYHPRGFIVPRQFLRNVSAG